MGVIKTSADMGGTPSKTSMSKAIGPKKIINTSVSHMKFQKSNFGKGKPSSKNVINGCVNK